MPYDITDLAPQVAELARYYAEEVAPGIATQSQRGGELLRQTTQEALREAAMRAALYIQAWPEEPPAGAIAAPPCPENYLVLAVDGSAIEPEDPEPLPHCVIHAATAGFAYAPSAYWVAHSVALRYTEADMQLRLADGGDPLEVSGPVVATLRAFAELQLLAHELPVAQQRQAGRPLLALMDAIMLWSHRGVGESHEAFKREYLMRSVALVDEFRQAQVPLASFISGPRHREVVHTLMTLFCTNPGHTGGCGNCRNPAPECQSLRGLQDRHLFAFLQPGERSAVFRSLYRGNMQWRLGDIASVRDPRLAFCYLNMGPEVVRVEFPFAVYEGEQLALVQAMLVDQCSSRRSEQPGYPVALTMAHREAALSTADRATLQWLIEDALARYGVTVLPRAKSQMKEA